MKHIIKRSSYTTRCPYCDIEFTYQYEDTYLVESPEKCRVVTCPNCSKENLHRDNIGRNRLTDTMHC